MLLALGFTAVLTAGLVNRLLDPRLTGAGGRSAVPRRDHVVVVGLGQVGQRLWSCCATWVCRDATSEVQSLFHIGVVRDVYRIAGSALGAVVVGYDVREAFPYQGTMYLVGETGEIEPFVLPRGND